MGIHEDDDPVEKARNFAITFQLNEDMELGLCNLIQAYINQKLQAESQEFSESSSQYSEESAEFEDLED